MGENEITGAKLVCTETVMPKWLSITIGIIGVLIAFFYTATNSAAFYLCLGFSLVMVVFPFLEKSKTARTLTIDHHTIKTLDGRIFNVKSIREAKLLIKPKWSRYQQSYIKIWMKNGSSDEFSVHGLDIKPKKILEYINALIKIR